MMEPPTFRRFVVYTVASEQLYRSITERNGGPFNPAFGLSGVITPAGVSDALKRRLKGIRLGTTERGTAMIAAKRNEMPLSRFFEAPQSPGHGTV